MSKPIGFLVWCPERGLPSYVHPTFLGAVAEASRLKRLNPGKRFVVMSPVEDMSGIGYALGFTNGRAEGLAQAHSEIMHAEAAHDRLSDRMDDMKREMRSLMEIKTKHRAFQAIVADCLLWFDGFAAAFSPKDCWERPHVPNRETLRDLNAALLSLEAPDDDAEFADIPF